MKLTSPGMSIAIELLLEKLSLKLYNVQRLLQCIIFFNVGVNLQHVMVVLGHRHHVPIISELQSAGSTDCHIITPEVSTMPPFLCKYRDVESVAMRVAYVDIPRGVDVDAAGVHHQCLVSDCPQISTNLVKHLNTVSLKYNKQGIRIGLIDVIN